MIKLGLDLHGVLDAAPKFFSLLAKQMREEGHEVHIITGREDTEELWYELCECGIAGVHHKYYDSILSITTYQKKLGTPVCYLDDDPTQPMMDPKAWNPTKATLCATAGIDIMIDDSTLYEPYFRDIKTQYIIYSPAVMEWLNFLFYRGGIEL